MHVIDHSLAGPSAAAAALGSGSPQAGWDPLTAWGLGAATQRDSAMATPPPPGQITTTASARGWSGKAHQFGSCHKTRPRETACPAQSCQLPVGGHTPCPSRCHQCENVEGPKVLGNVALSAELLCHRTG